MTTDDNRHWSTGGGMYRIFQQSVKELGSVKEHKITSSPSSTTKRPFKGYRVFDVNNVTSSENIRNLDKINEMEREEKVLDKNAKRREGFKRAHTGCEAYSVNDEIRTRRDNEVKNIHRYEGGGSRFNRGFSNRKHALDKGRSSQRGIHINKGNTPHNVSSNVKSKPLSLIEPVCADVQSTIHVHGEDWSQDLIDTTVDGNHNVIMKPNTTAKISLNSVVALDTNADSIQAVAGEPETLSSGNGILGMNPKDGIMDHVHQKFSPDDNENNNNYDVLNNDMYGNTVYSYDTASNQENIEDRKLHIQILPTETTTEILNEVSQSDSKAIMTDVSLNRNLAPNNQKQKVSESVKSKNVELNVDNFNTNRILEHDSKLETIGGKNVSEDWSLELDEVDVDLFRLRNTKLLDTPTDVSMNFSLGINEPNNLKRSSYNYNDNGKTDNMKTTNIVKNVDKELLSVENLHIEDELDNKVVEIKDLETNSECTQYSGYRSTAEQCSISSDKYGPINTAEGSLKGTFQKQSTALFPKFETGSGQNDLSKMSPSGDLSSFEENNVSDELNSQCELNISGNIRGKSEFDVKESNGCSTAGERVSPIIREKGSELFLKGREKVQIRSPDTAFDIKVMNFDTSKVNGDICDSDIPGSEEILEGLIMCSSPIKVSADSNKQMLQVDCVDQNSEQPDEKESLEIFFKEALDKACKGESATGCESTDSVDRKRLNNTPKEQDDLVNERKNVDKISSKTMSLEIQGRESKCCNGNIKTRENQEKQKGYYDEQTTRSHSFEKNRLESLSRKANSDKHYYQQKGQNTVSYSTTASKYSSHYDNNIVPPRFMKKLCPRNAYELQNRHVHGKRSVSPENCIHWDKTHNKDQYSTGTYFGGGGKVSDIGTEGFGNRIRKESVKQRGIDSVIQRRINSKKQRETDRKRHVSRKLPIQTTNVKAHKEKAQRGETVAEMDAHVPEDWHVEIDERNRILETAGGVWDVTERSSKQTVTSKENKFLPPEAVSNERTVKVSNSALPKPLLAKLKMDEEKQDVNNHQHTFISDEKCFDEKKKPYLPPSPDEMEQACFMSYMSKNESNNTCSKVSGKGQSDLNLIDTAKSSQRKDLGTNMSQVEKMFVQSTDICESEKQDMPLSEAAMLDSHLLKFALQKELEHQVRGSESQSFGIDYISESHSLEGLSVPMNKNVSENPVEIDINKCLVETDPSIDVGDFDSKGSSASDIAKSDKQDFPLDLQSDQGFDTGNVDDTYQEVNESTADKKHLDETSGSMVKTSHPRADYSDIVTDTVTDTEKMDKTCVNRGNSVFRDVESGDERLIVKADPSRNNHTHENAVHYETQKEMPGEYEKLDYSEMGSWAGGPVPAFTNQFQPAPWQHYHSSYYYTEHYRKWYEQVYVPHYTRYMQYFGYYNMPYESCAHPYYVNEKISENGLQTIHEAAEPNLQKSGALFSQTSYDQHKQSEIRKIRNMSHSSLLNSEAKEKPASTDNKLSDYWAEHMPDWVENQSKAAKLKNDIKSADKRADNVAVVSNKLERQKTGFPGKTISSSLDSLKQDLEKKNSEHEYKVVVKDESESISESDKIQPVQNKDTKQGINVSCSEVELHGLEGEDKRSDVAIKSIENNLSEGIEKRNDLNDKKQLKENDSIMDMTASDSNIGLTGTDSDSFTLHQKPGCTCGPDGIQYWLWKTCQCSAGRIPALEDILPVYPEDRSVDQGYQSYESLVAEDGAPLEKKGSQLQNNPQRGPHPIYFTTVCPTRPCSGELQTSSQQRESDKAGPTVEFNNSTGKQKVGPPPGFRAQVKNCGDLDKDKEYLPIKMDTDQANRQHLKNLHTSSKTDNLVDSNNNREEAILRDRNSEQKPGGKLREIIELSKRRNEAVKAAMQKSLKHKENAENEVKSKLYTDNAEPVDKGAEVLITKMKQFSDDSGSERSMSLEKIESKVVVKGSSLKEQIDKMRSKPNNVNDEKLNSTTYSQKDSSAHSVGSSLGRWQVEQMQPSTMTVTVKNLEGVRNVDIQGDKRLVQVNNKTVYRAAEYDKTEKQVTVGNGKHEGCVNVNMPKARNRSCTVSVSDSMAEIELKSNSSGEDKLLSEVRSQSSNVSSDEEGEIKEHDIIARQVAENAGTVYCRKTERMQTPAPFDSNNNYMNEFPVRHPSPCYPGFRLPYRPTHNSGPSFAYGAVPYNYGTKMSPGNVSAQTGFERSPVENRQGQIRDEMPSEGAPCPWTKTRAPIFRPRTFHETQLFPSPWYMPPPPPPLLPNLTTVAEGQRKIYRPTYEQYCSNINQRQYEEVSSYQSPPPAPPMSSDGVTGITPDLDKKATCSEKPHSAAKKCLEKSMTKKVRKKNKLVDYNSTDDSPMDDGIEDFEVSTLDSTSESEKAKLAFKQKTVSALGGGYDGIKHTSKRFKASSPETTSNLHAGIANASGTLSNYDTSLGVVSQSHSQLTRKPMRRLKQTALKSFSSDTPEKVVQPKSHELERKMTHSEVVVANLKKDEKQVSGPPNIAEQASGMSSADTVAEQLYSEKCRQNIPSYPPLPPFPASPFWGMYLTNSRSALEGKDPNEDLYSPKTASAAQGPQSALNSWNRFSLSPAGRADPRMLFSPSETDSENQSRKSDGLKYFKRFHSFGVKYIDTHCHLDFLFSRSNFKGDLKQYMEENPDSFPETFEGCVAIFCYPTNFSPTDEVVCRLIEDDSVWFAMGCHPKMATEFTEAAEWGLKQCLKHKKCVALGEIGLDYSGTFRKHEAVQKMVFKRQLKIAVAVGKPLVIHCRDAEEDCLEIMKEMVPKNFKIHCHCFTKAYANAEVWMEAFPNLFIGMTPLVTYPKATPSHDLARKIPLNKLLLETDAPYFVPRCRPRLDMEFSNPGFAITVAKAVAQHQEVPVAMVLRQCRVNTKFMYGI